MTGFIKGLLGNKDDNQPKEAFFLDADSASSLGDVDFMRKPKTVKRSYPKAAGKINDIEGETEKSVSSTKKQENTVEAKRSSYSSSYTPSTSTSSFPQPSKFTSTPSKTPNNNNSSDGIDFKNMARNINKKR